MLFEEVLLFKKGLRETYYSVNHGLQDDKQDALR